MRFHSIGYILFFVLTMLVHDSFSQKFNPKNRYHSIGASVNTMTYVGEVDPHPAVISPALKFTKYNIGVCYIYRYTPNVSFRGNVSYGRIKGDDAINADYSPENIHRKLRNLNFRNQIVEVKADVIVDFVGHRLHYRKRPNWVPYGVFGLAYFHHNPEGYSPDGKWIPLRPLSTEGQGLPGTGKKQYSLNQIAIPLGLGIRYKINKHWDIAFEASWRITFTDYLDDVSGNYIDRDLLIANKGQLAADMADRTKEAINNDPKLKDFVEHRQGGYVYKNNKPIPTSDKDSYKYINGYDIPGGQRGSKNKDWYIVTGFHLTYILPERIICPKFRK